MVGREGSSRSPVGTTNDLDAVLARFDESVREVHAFVWRRCGDRAVAEDLTAEVFLAAVRHAKEHPDMPLTMGWLLTVARTKLLNHWRTQEREQRRLRLVANDRSTVEDDDDFGQGALDVERFSASLGSLPPAQQAALALRYLDDLSVPEVAESLGRSVHAAESLLARARANFRATYVGGGDV